MPYIGSSDDYHESLPLEGQHELLILRRSQAHSVDNEMNVNVTNNVRVSFVNGAPADDDDFNFKDAVRLDEVETISVKPRFRYLQESYCVKRQKVPDIVEEAVELADELVRQVGESGIQVANDAALVTLLSVQTEVVSLLAYLKKACEEASSAKVELDVLRSTAELATKEHNVTLAKVQEEQREKDNAWKALTSRREATLTKLHEDKSVEMSKLRSEQDSAATRHRIMLASIRRVAKAREERKNNTADTLVKLRKI